MTNQLHPSLEDIIPSVVLTIYRRYRQWVEKGDLTQEAWAFALSRAEQFNELLSEESDLIRKWNEKKVGWQIRRALERYSRKEKAVKSGYRINDEAYYDTVTIAQLLPFVIKSVVKDTSLEQSQVMINDGQPRKPGAPAEGGNLLAMLIDIKKSYEKLSEEEQEILKLRYYESITLQQLAQYLECAISTAERKANNALRALQNNLGGDSPWQ